MTDLSAILHRNCRLITNVQLWCCFKPRLIGKRIHFYLTDAVQQRKDVNQYKPNYIRSGRVLQLAVICMFTTQFVLNLISVITVNTWIGFLWLVRLRWPVNWWQLKCSWLIRHGFVYIQLPSCIKIHLFRNRCADAWAIQNIVSSDMNWDRMIKVFFALWKLYGLLWITTQDSVQNFFSYRGYLWGIKVPLHWWLKTVF